MVWRGRAERHGQEHRCAHQSRARPNRQFGGYSREVTGRRRGAVDELARRFHCVPRAPQAPTRQAAGRRGCRREVSSNTCMTKSRRGERRCGDSYGWESREAVFDKFKMLAGSCVKPSQVDSALNAIMSMEDAADVRSIVDTVVPVG